MDGIVAAQLAAHGFTAARGLFEPGGGLDTALVQDRSVSFAPIDLAGWRILENSFKPYAACHLTHPAVDAARALAPLVARHGGIVSARAEIGALAQQITGGKSGEPATPLEGKFDLKYCIALGLHGYALSAADFREPWRLDPAICVTARKIESRVSPEMGFASAQVTVEFADGGRERAHVPVAKGHPGNPMGWDDMHAKFDALVSPRLGGRADPLFALVQDFGGGDVLDEIRAVLARL
jgi:2-methylcitrate dehydratase PrpD